MEEGEGRREKRGVREVWSAQQRLVLLYKHVKHVHVHVHMR